jgi:PAS domain S-box-containing protein
MMREDDEDTLLRSVALQNANSILVARQRDERRQQAYLAEAQGLSHTGSFGWRLSTGEIIWSAETFRIYHYDPTTEPTLARLLQRVHPDDVALVRETIERASQTGEDFDSEHRLLMPDRSIRYVRIVAHAVSDDAVSVEFVGAVMDVTAQNQARAALERAVDDIKRSEDRLRLVIDTIPALIWTARPDGSLDFVSQRWLDYAGVTLEQQLGEAWGAQCHPDDIAHLRTKWRVAVSEGTPFEAEARVRRFDGVYRWFLSRAFPLFDGSGHVLGWYGHDVDIQDRKQAEDQLQQAQADLAHVSRVTIMGELTASLAHEVKQPIAAAVVDASTCVRWLAREPPDIAEARAAALRIVNDGRRATDIISRIRLLFTKGAPQREPVDVNDLIREMLVLLRSEATRFDVSVRTALADDLPRVMGDRVQLQQVLMNLIVNGIDAMRAVEGPRDLTITSNPGNGEGLVVSVSDTGVGLPPLGGDQIFKAFFTTKESGIGMGLSISRSIAESHGGSLLAANHSPRGASFRLTLPTVVGGPV